MLDKRTTRSRSPEPQPAQSRALSWSGYALFIWSIAYMLPHLYWALGGRLGLALLKPSIAALPQWEMINWVASGFLTIAGCFGLAFVYLRPRGFLAWLLLATALIGCAVATSHGIYGIVNRLLQITGVVALEAGPFKLGQHAYVIWDMMLFEPWFLIEGILLGFVGWSYLAKPRHRPIWLVLCGIGVGVGLVTGLLGVRFA